MESILDIFFKPDLEKKEEKKIKIVNTNNRWDSSTQSNFPSLMQGKKFHKYQDKIIAKLESQIDNVNSKEGFDNLQQTKEEYKKTLDEYNSLLGTIANNTNQFIERSLPSNPYANKIIRWTDPEAEGQLFYVTRKGVARPILNTNTILGKNGCPSMDNIMDITIKWDPSYLIPNTIIPTNPSLMVGPQFKEGESCGNEGSGIIASKLVDDISQTYKGCYADNLNKPTMTFIGGTPAPENYIQNGNFDQPAIQNNTFKYYADTYDIPGWFMTAVLLNNSSAWGYPMPYPAGNQCISIQRTHTLSTLDLDLQTKNYTLSFMACGRNCCDRSGQANPIDIFLGDVKIFSINPPVNKWTSYTTKFTPANAGKQRIIFKGTWSEGDRSTAIQNVYLGLSDGTGGGEYTFNMCREAAIDGQYKFFGLQNFSTSNNKGYCSVSNDFVSASQYGTAYSVTGGIVVWSTNTGNKDGSSAQLSDLGQLLVFNSAGAVVFETENKTLQNPEGGSFVGCYRDTSDRAMTWLNNKKYKSPDVCISVAREKKYKYYGLQNSINGTKNDNACFGSNDLNTAMKYGRSSNCRVVNKLVSGGPWANAIYSVDPPSGNYFLIIQNDGNVFIYRGSGPNDQHDLIWNTTLSVLNGKPNPKFEASKGKYGRNWIRNGETLGKGDFVGSNNGNMYLQMSNDGNLVLCISQNQINCQSVTGSTTSYKAGGVAANAIYELDQVAVPEKLGEIGYIDIDSTKYSFPEDSMSLGTNYSLFQNSDSPGNDIINAAISNSTVEACKEKCNSNNDCHGFVFNKQTKTCYPKGSGMFPVGQRTILGNNIADLYVREKTVNNNNNNKLVEGMETIKNVDTIRFDNYRESNKDISHRKKVADMVMTSSQRQQLDQIFSRLNMLGEKISNSTATDRDGINNINNKIQENNKLLDEKMSEKGVVDNYNNIGELYKFLGTEDRNLENMLKDSNLNVLHENYNYILWTSLAVGTLLVTLNVTK